MGTIRIGRYDAVGKLCEVIEVDKECVEFDAFDEKKVFIKCEELREKLRGWIVEVLPEEEEEEEEEEDRWYRRRKRTRVKRERNRRKNRRRRKLW